MQLGFALLNEIMRGEVVISPGLAAQVLTEFALDKELSEETAEAEPVTPTLTPHQAEVLKWVARGLTYREIGLKLHVAESTVKYHMGQVIQRLQVQDYREAAQYAREHSLDT